MARPFKSGVDYFPLDVVMDDKVELLEAEHGITGFGIYVKLYQKVYASNYWIKWCNKSVIVFSSRINVDINLVNAIINSCLEWDIFNKKLYEEFNILTSTGIQKRFFEITKRRKEIEIINKFLLISLPENTNTKWINVDNNSINESNSTQSKGKGKKRKAKEVIYSAAFEKWWLKYPKRNGRKVGKENSYKLFDKINKTDWINLNTATENYIIECNNLPKDPERFLKNDFWKDYIKPADNTGTNQDDGAAEAQQRIKKTQEYLEQ